MRNWGEQHRARLKQSSKARRAKHTLVASSTGIPIPSHNPPGAPIAGDNPSNVPIAGQKRPTVPAG
jgi:hypothetical protein